MAAPVYATIADFELILSERESADLSDLDDVGRMSTQTGRVQNALSAASRDIDAVLYARGYTLPLSTTGAPYIQLVDIAVFLAWEKLNIFGDRAEVKSKADNARYRLENIYLIDNNGSPVPIGGAVDGGAMDTGYNALPWVGDRNPIPLPVESIYFGAVPIDWGDATNG